MYLEGVPQKTISTIGKLIDDGRYVTVKREFPEVYAYLSRFFSGNTRYIRATLGDPTHINVCSAEGCSNYVTPGTYGYVRYCSRRCSSAAPEVQEVRARTSNYLYGADWYARTPGFVSHLESDSLELYGVPSIMQLPDVIARREATALRNRKLKGVLHHMQTPEGADRCFKASHRKKEWINPVTGHRHWVQGYEPQVLDWFMENGANTVQTDKASMPNIWYGDPISGKVRRYFPDFRCVSPKGRRIVVEVKSDYTLCGSTDILSMNLAKFKSALVSCKREDTAFAVVVLRRGEAHVVISPNRNKIAELRVGIFC